MDLWDSDGTLLFSQNIDQTLQVALDPTGTNDSLSNVPLSDVRIGYLATDGDLIAGATIRNIFGGQFTPTQGDFGIRIDDVSFNAVPEPSSFGLLGMGLVYAGFVTRRRKIQRQRESRPWTD